MSTARSPKSSLKSPPMIVTQLSSASAFANAGRSRRFGAQDRSRVVTGEKRPQPVLRCFRCVYYRLTGSKGSILSLFARGIEPLCVPDVLKRRYRSLDVLKRQPLYWPELLRPKTCATEKALASWILTLSIYFFLQKMRAARPQLLGTKMKRLVCLCGRKKESHCH